jgi:hypothetical protein
MADWAADVLACLALAASVFMLVRDHRRNREASLEARHETFTKVSGGRTSTEQRLVLLNHGPLRCE